ncbi:MAG: HAD family hydrolase [Lautropia sp.]
MIDALAPHPEPIRAVLFDMDGTLCDSMPSHDEAWVRFLAARGVDIDVERFLRETAGLRNADIVRAYLGAHGGIDDAEAIRIGFAKEALFREIYGPRLAPIEGLHAALDALAAAGASLALATSADRDNVAFTLAGLGIEGRFATVVGAEDVLRGKPHPDGYLLASERLGVAPDACLVVEDSRVGIEAARRAGMRVAVILSSLDAADPLLDSPHVAGAAADFTRLDLPLILRGATPMPAPSRPTAPR